MLDVAPRRKLDCESDSPINPGNMSGLSPLGPRLRGRSGKFTSVLSPCGLALVGTMVHNRVQAVHVVAIGMWDIEAVQCT